MTGALPGADVRGFYRALGIELPGWAKREAALRIAADLRAAGVRGSIVDLARARADGYDLTEWLAEREGLGARELRAALGAPGARPRSGVPAAGR